MADDGGYSRIWPVIVAGGTGSRLWPASRELFPKQFMALAGDRPMLQETVKRMNGPGFHPPLLLCNEEHRFIVAEQLRGIGIAPEAIVLEPVGRNTAPAAAVAAVALAETDPDAVMLLAPADHVIADETAFGAGIETALPAARAGYLVTFGITPDKPETGYGYIERGGEIDEAKGVFAIARFTEKPDTATARGYLASGRHFWNSGIFMMAAKTFIEELERLAPAILHAAREALQGASRDLDFLRLAAAPYGQAPNISIDYAVMEKTEKGAVLPLDMGWSDVGSWDALWDIADKDEGGNVIRGDVIAEGTRNAYLRSEGRLLAAVGVENVVVVATDDAVLVAEKNAAQDVKTVVERLREAGRPEPVAHTTTYRPWGSFQTVDTGDRFQVKRITVVPGGCLSLQKHARRAEHWVVVAGTATVTRGDEVIELGPNQSTYIPIGLAHRLENKAAEPLHLIEVQSGDYLGEDDIERLEDIYGRA